MSSTITLSEMEASQLTQRAKSQADSADNARRARLILLLDAGHTWTAIRDKFACTDSFIDRWSMQFASERLPGLFSRHAGQLPTTLSPKLEARILEWTVKRHYNKVPKTVKWRYFDPSRRITPHSAVTVV